MTKKNGCESDMEPYMPINEDWSGVTQILRQKNPDKLSHGKQGDIAIKRKNKMCCNMYISSI